MLDGKQEAKTVNHHGRIDAANNKIKEVEWNHNGKGKATRGSYKMFLAIEKTGIAKHTGV